MTNFEILFDNVYFVCSLQNLDEDELISLMMMNEALNQGCKARSGFAMLLASYLLLQLDSKSEAERLGEFPFASFNFQLNSASKPYNRILKNKKIILY